MNRISEAFRTCEQAGGKALIPYITAGDPDLQKTSEILDFLASHGADVIEVGVPFSDPMADGPVIQRAMERALQAGATLKKVLKAVKDFRRRHVTPVVLMGYYNPFLAYGLEAFAQDAHDAGVDGVLTVDLPPEEAGEFTGLLRKRGLVSIFLLTPVSDEPRIRTVKKVADGFVYFVSVTGVTGERTIKPEDIQDKIGEIKRTIDLPLALGFGISGPDTIRAFSPYVDGFVVGSALIKRLVEGAFSLDENGAFCTFFRNLEKACHGG